MKRSPKAILKSTLRAAILPMARAAAGRPLVKRLARALLERVPALQGRVDAILGRAAPLPPRRMHAPQDSNDLSPAVQAHYQELKRHFETRKKLDADRH